MGEKNKHCQTSKKEDCASFFHNKIVFFNLLFLIYSSYIIYLINLLKVLHQTF